MMKIKNDEIKTGIIMEGGAIRGMFTAGVIDVLMENGIDFDGAAGVSAGAAFGCNIKSKQIGRAVRFTKAYCKDKRFFGVYSLLHTGNFFGVDFSYKLLPYYFDLWDEKTFRENPMEFYTVVTDVVNGKPFYKKLENGDLYDLKWMRASASMPIISYPVRLDGRKYLDGGMSDPIPLKFMRNLGYNRIVIVRTKPESYRKEPFNPFLLKLVERTYRSKYPGVAYALKNLSRVYNEQLDYIEKCKKDGNCLVIAPKIELDMKDTEKNPKKIQAAYDAGRHVASAKLSDIAEFLQCKNSETYKK
ncbi:MAG: patatin-like phospholipase family protein [Candidatus Fimenecus sp.]